MPQLAYISFDLVPAPKGAAIHIQAFARALALQYGCIDLVTIAPGSEPTGPHERWPGVRHTELPALGASLIDRVLCFQRWLARWLQQHTFDVVHFRSIFEGLAILAHARPARLVFEVNGLPSIELKYRYPKVAGDDELLRKIVAQERACLQAASIVVTPSFLTQRYLTQRYGLQASKIRVIPNGVDLSLFQPAPPHGRREDAVARLLYFGTLSPWQGVDLAIRAIPRLEATLTVIGAGSNRQREQLASLAAKLGVRDRVRLLPPLPQEELCGHLHQSSVVTAPLTLNDRNVVQGCCPLKVLEAMAAGVPVIASDMAITRELGVNGVHFLLSKPGSVDQIVEAVQRLQADPALARALAQNARARVAAEFTWQRAGEALTKAYAEVLQDEAVPAPG